MAEIRVGSLVYENGSIGVEQEWIKQNHPYALNKKPMRVLRITDSCYAVQQRPDDTVGHEWSKGYLSLCPRKPTIVIMP